MLLFAEPCAAQVVLADGFEGPLLDGGQWDSASTPFPGQSIFITPLAAHTGDAGLRIEDLDSDAGIGSGPAVLRFFGGTGDQYLRTWWRPSPTPLSLNLSMLSYSASSYTALQAKWTGNTDSIFLGCWSSLGSFVNPIKVVPLVPDAGFHLIETATLGMGTANGTCLLALDGVEVDRKAVDFSGETYQVLSLGPVYGELAWVGTMDYDSARAGPTPTASHLLLLDAGTLTEGACARLTLVFADSFGGVGSLAADDTVTLGLDGGQAFADPQCQVVGTQLHLAAGATVAEFGAVPSRPGLMEVTATTPDLVGSDDLLLVQAGPLDGGSGSGSRPLRLGCDCAGAPSAELVGLALALALVRRLRPRRAVHQRGHREEQPRSHR